MDVGEEHYGEGPPFMSTLTKFKNWVNVKLILDQVSSCHINRSVGSWDIPQPVSQGIASQYNALRILRITVIEQHHFRGKHEAFGCPAPYCDAWFERPENTRQIWRRGNMTKIAMSYQNVVVHYLWMARGDWNAYGRAKVRSPKRSRCGGKFIDLRSERLPRRNCIVRWSLIRYRFKMGYFSSKDGWIQYDFSTGGGTMNSSLKHIYGKACRIGEHCGMH
ncbi:hypothetical protein DPSP01_013329 [Paraphaeosphaeria sporulosa]|uniref:Uncharacterized protein n=1 Tax=Paraphaeosphaeria sporulosa TaxID=1460663 RepID=A0A177D103_9PLEO|nr:uncharacterized protein CC84DRAFT_179763 [Paraphaeosphaeria sporulosa]OAG13088.1 hypothetical protein CC84DRAFT_179763 [Paraphaeosphaeria sporulosa]